MSMRIEITSIEDVDLDSIRGKELSEVEKDKSNGSDGNEMTEGEFYDASDELPSDKEDSKTKPSRKQRKMMKQMKKALLKLRNGGQVEIEVNLTTQSPKKETKYGDLNETREPQEKETKRDTEEELESDGIPNFKNKDHFLKDVNAKDCIKDKVTKCFKMQFWGLELKRPSKPNKNGSHYHLAQRRKTTKGIVLLERFEDCRSDWELEEDDE